MCLGSLLRTYFTYNTTVAVVKLGGEIQTATLLIEAMVSVLKVAPDLVCSSVLFDPENSAKLWLSEKPLRSIRKIASGSITITLDRLYHSE
jgi:hypothetical protein